MFQIKIQTKHNSTKILKIKTLQIKCSSLNSKETAMQLSIIKETSKMRKLKIQETKQLILLTVKFQITINLFIKL